MVLSVLGVARDQVQSMWQKINDRRQPLRGALGRTREIHNQSAADRSRPGPRQRRVLSRLQAPGHHEMG